MARLDLRKTLGFSVQIDNGEILESELTYSSSQSFAIKDMRKQLLNPDITCPEIFYTKYVSFDKDDIYEEKGININLLVVHPNLAGIEYVKTKGIRSSKFPRIIEVVQGAGTIIMQNFETKYEGDVITVPLRKDTKVVVPADYAYSIANTRTSMLVVSEISSVKSIDIDELDDMNGMSYYLIRKNAKQEIVRNPEYRIVSSPRKIKWDQVLSKLGVTLKTPIIKQILRKYDKFEWLFKENSFTI